MKRRLLLAGLITLGCGLSALLLYKTSITSQQISTTFTRKLRPPLKVKRFATLPSRHSTLVGITEGRIYVSQTIPFDILGYDTILQATDHKRIQLYGDSLTHSVPEVLVQGNQFYVVDYSRNQFYFGRLNDLVTKKWISSSFMLAEALPLDTSNFIVRMLREDVREFTIAKLSSTNKVIQNTLLLQKQVDGIFCTDGKLLI
ncbi:MAG TPA: hypothetical protein VFE57_07320, partial [Cyclobacteriaceae bacterium]|nr:hypothetical protein [Cyclobacteriaceae bacterium]